MLPCCVQALKNGEFYFSCGPEIYNFYVDGGDLTHAEFDIENYWAGPYDYVRISITDKDGNKACPNPIFF